MVFVKRVATAITVAAVLIVAAAYLPAPISTVAGIILAGFALLLLLPLILAVIGMISVFVSDNEDGGLFGGILEAWFLWSVLDWLWLALKWPVIVVKWVFTKLWPDSTEKRKRQEEPPFNREV